MYYIFLSSHKIVPVVLSMINFNNKITNHYSSYPFGTPNRLLGNHSWQLNINIFQLNDNECYIKKFHKKLFFSITLVLFTCAKLTKFHTKPPKLGRIVPIGHIILTIP